MLCFFRANQKSSLPNCCVLGFCSFDKHTSNKNFHQISELGCSGTMDLSLEQCILHVNLNTIHGIILLTSVESHAYDISSLCINIMILFDTLCCNNVTANLL